MSMQLLVIQFKISHMVYAVEILMFKIFKILNCPIYSKMAKSFCSHNSHEVLCSGCIYNLYVDTVVVLARHVHTNCIYSHHKFM